MKKILPQNKQHDILTMIQKYEQSLEETPNNQEFIINCANLYIHLNHPEKALPHYLYLSSINPDYPKIFLLIADSYLKLNKVTTALFIYQGIIKEMNDPTEVADAWYKIGLIYERLKQDTEAENCFTKAITIDHNHFYAYNALNRVNLINMQREMQERGIPTVHLLQAIKEREAIIKKTSANFTLTIPTTSSTTQTILPPGN